jgi:hypothetical protein
MLKVGDESKLIGEAIATCIKWQSTLMLLAYALTVAFVFWENATFFFSRKLRPKRDRPRVVQGSGTVSTGGTAVMPLAYACTPWQPVVHEATVESTNRPNRGDNEPKGGISAFKGPLETP